MPWRLEFELDGRRRRVPLGDGAQEIGSGTDAGIRLPHPSVSRRHGRIRVSGEAVWLQDLGSRNGTFVDGEPVSRSVVIEAGARLRFGQVTAILRRLGENELEPAVHLAEAGERAGSPSTTQGMFASGATAGVGVIPAFALEDLPSVLEVVGTAGSSEVVRQLGAALFRRLPALRVEMRRRSPLGGVLFRAEHESGSEDGRTDRATILCEAGLFECEVDFAEPAHCRLFEPVVELAAEVIRLASRTTSVRDPRARSSAPRSSEVSLPSPETLDPRTAKIYTEARRVAAGRISVLIHGESGTGKEVLARFLHRASPWAEGPFIALNCAALPRDLLEAELFGIEKGVATGVEARRGRFEQADGGTLFLDEIGDMEPSTQAKILRVLQEGELYRLGADRPRSAAPRLLAATNRDLDELLASGSFRRDLYHRIADWRVELPPLRRRRVDIPNLAGYFLGRAATERGVSIAGISRAALDLLETYVWPGNIRQLEREMARAALFVDEGELLEAADLQEEIRLQTVSGSEEGALRERVDLFELRVVREALVRCGEDVDAAAEALGISRATLYRKLRRAT